MALWPLITMPRLDLPSFQKHLAAFNVNALCVEVLGWEHPPRGERDWQADQIKGDAFSHRMVAQLAGVAVLLEFKPQSVFVEVKKFIIPQTRHVAVSLTKRLN